MNLIDRDKLILYLNDWAYSIAPDYVREDVLVEEVIRGIEYNTIMRVIEAIDKVPTVNQWIPCEERLPKEDEMVIISTIDGVSVGILTHDLIDKQYWELCNDFSYTWELENVIAWQPLPEPYKEINYENKKIQMHG